MLYCAKHLPQQGITGWLGPPVGCGKDGAVPDIVGTEEALDAVAIELEVVAIELEVNSGSDDVLGAGAALPVLPKQKDCTHPK